LNTAITKKGGCERGKEKERRKELKGCGVQAWTQGRCEVKKVWRTSKLDLCIQDEEQEKVVMGGGRRLRGGKEVRVKE